VFQVDEPAAPGEIVTGPAALEEPKLRSSGKKAEAAPSGDTADVIKKWSSK
jgi:hypothetical protein